MNIDNLLETQKALNKFLANYYGSRDCVLETDEEYVLGRHMREASDSLHFYIEDILNPELKEEQQNE